GAESDRDSLSYSAPAPTPKGAIAVAAAGSFTYTPTAAARHAAASPRATAADRSDAFTVTASDGHGGSIAIPVAVAVGAFNAAPTGTARVGSPNPATGAVVGSVAGSDADGDPLTYSGSATTTKGTVTVGPDGSFTYRPTAAARHLAAALSAGAGDTTDTFTVTVADNYGGSVAVPVLVSIGPANTAPTASVDVRAIDPTTGAVSSRVIASDADSDPLTFGGSVTTAKGTAAVAADGAFTYTPTPAARHAAAKLTAAAADRVDAFTVVVSDGHGGTTSVPIGVNILPANTAPTASADFGAPDVTTGIVAGALIGSDANGDALSYNGSQTTGKGAVVVAADGTFTYTPTALARHAASLAGAAPADTIDSFTLAVADGYGGTVDVPVTVAVSPASVRFNFVYGSGSQYWTPAERSALQAAADRLSSSIVVNAPVTLTYDVVGQNNPSSGLLATAFAKFGTSGPGYYATVVQTKVQTGVDQNGPTSDSQITVNFAYPWALGDSVPNNQYDFQSVAMHELLHTFGFMTGLGEPSGIDRNWTTYDKYLATANGTSPIGGDYTWNAAYTPNLTGSGGGLYFTGPNAEAAYGGPVPLYTPSPWSSGSSLTHLDPAHAPAGTTYLMDPNDGQGPGVRVITAVELGMLKDLGYTVYPG
ncbi:MAG: Ig-like domain-containing protein, partial [Mycobacterium sp.]